MKKVKIASIILLVHGIIEVFGIIGSIMATTTESVDISKYMQFIVPYFQDNLALVCYTGCIYGVLRIIGAIGLLKNRLWGFALSMICSIITLVLMMFVLPAGIMDGILASAVLLLLLLSYYDKKKIIG